MSAILQGILITAFLFLVFLFLLVFGVKKNRKSAVFVSAIFLLSSMVAGVWTASVLVKKTYNKAKNSKFGFIKPRPGEEIYSALFGEPSQQCVEIINSTDQITPRLDCCIWLEFRTCKPELDRVLTLQAYKTSVLLGSDTSQYTLGYTPQPAWFRPGTLGDSILMLRSYKPDNPNRDQVFFISKDSTRAYYCDMAD